jgi:hypothetical protein
MKLGKKMRTVAVGAACVAGALAFATAPASAASGWRVDSWNDHCNYTGYFGCLYYSPNGSGGIFGANSYVPSLLNGQRFSDGHVVADDAASIGNYTANCGSTTWVYPNAGGDWNWVPHGRGGNLNSYLRNNEESFNPVASCT